MACFKLLHNAAIARKYIPSLNDVGFFVWSAGL
jgi:hypothetical protein